MVSQRELHLHPRPRCFAGQLTHASLSYTTLPPLESTHVSPYVPFAAVTSLIPIPILPQSQPRRPSTIPPWRRFIEAELRLALQPNLCCLKPCTRCSRPIFGPVRPSRLLLLHLLSTQWLARALAPAIKPPSPSRPSPAAIAHRNGSKPRHTTTTATTGEVTTRTTSTAATMSPSLPIRLRQHRPCRLMRSNARNDRPASILETMAPGDSTVGPIQFYNEATQPTSGEAVPQS